MKPRVKKPAPFRLTPAGLAGSFALLLLCLMGAVFSFTSAFAVPLVPRLLAAACVGWALAALLTWSLPRRWWALPLALSAAAWGYGLWRLWDALVLGEIALRCAVVNTFCTSLSLDGFIQPIAQLPEETWALCATLLVSAAALPLALLLGLAIFRARSFWFVFWVTLPFVLAPLCISVTPGWLPLMALLLGWMTLGLTSLVRRRDPAGTARLTLLVLPAGAALLALLTLALPQEDYQRPAWADDALDGFQNWANHLDVALGEGNGPFGLFGGGGSLADADGSVDLSHTGPLRFSGRTVLEVDTDLRGRIYLRGFSGAEYDGESWQPLNDSAYGDLFLEEGEGDPFQYMGPSSVYWPSLEGFQPMNFPALADREANPGKEYAKVTVRNVGADPGYVYTPYHILTTPDELGGAEFVNDSHLARAENVWTHTLYIQPGVDPTDELELEGAAAQAEQYYFNFVYSNYTAVPEESYNALLNAGTRIYNDLMEALHGGDVLTPAQLVYQDAAVHFNSDDFDLFRREYSLAMAGLVAEYLGQIAEYDPDTPATPEGEDYVSYFLTESRRGYCMHFASAATLLLRTFGIPARYVVGYVADVPASGHVNVPDSAAHAWVEIYLDGYGWEPVEVTPAYAGSAPGQSLTTEPTPTPTATPTPSAAPSASAAPAPSAAPSAAPGPGEGVGVEIDLRVALIPLAVLLVVLAFPARRALGRAARRRRFRQENTNRAVIAVYRWMRRLERRGGQMPEVVAELAKKAAFSPHTLTEEERQAALAAAQEAAERLDVALPRWKKLWCRYGLGML